MPETVARSIATKQLIDWLADALRVDQFRDYAPNGLQVEGRPTLRRVVTGVTASAALLRAAIERDADAVLVHHGWFWKGEDPRVIGTRKTRLALALRHDLNVIGYHLPLDAHPVWGNNAQLARVLGLEPAWLPEGAGTTPTTAGRDGLIWLGHAPGLATLGELADRVGTALRRTPLVVGEATMPLGRIAWCTGAAQSLLQDAIDAGASAFITGEASEYTTHLARETGTGFIGAGHHATERYGVQALGEVIARQFGIEVEFIDIDNPV